MRTLILDIETVGEAWSEIDEVTKRVLERPIERRVEDPYDWIEQTAAMQTDLGLCPLTGSIITLGLYDLERAAGAVYHVGSKTELPNQVDGFVCKNRTETELLREFWEGALEYDTFVTFSGRSFDLPFILHRSLACVVRPTRELMKYRYLSQQSAPFHIDLQEELTFYGAMRRQPLHLFCRAYGINISKAGDITGADVGDHYRSGKHLDIITYNISDVRATAELYEKWRTNVAPQSFLDTIDL